MSGIDWTHLVALAIGIVVGALIVYTASEWFPDLPDRSDERVDLLAEWRREDGTYLPPPPVGGTGQAHAEWSLVSVPEAPHRETNPHPTQPAPSTTERLRLWTFDFGFIEELPLDVRLHDEGFIRLPIGSSAQRRINDAFDNDELVWLTVNGARGQWIGYCVRTHWSSERPGFCHFEFRPEPKRATVWASWSGLCQCPRHADPNHPACQQSYPQA